MIIGKAAWNISSSLIVDTIVRLMTFPNNTSNRTLRIAGTLSNDSNWGVIRESVERRGRRSMDWLRRQPNHFARRSIPRLNSHRAILPFGMMTSSQYSWRMPRFLCLQWSLKKWTMFILKGVGKRTRQLMVYLNKGLSRPVVKLDLFPRKEIARTIGYLPTSHPLPNFAGTMSLLVLQERWGAFRYVNQAHSSTRNFQRKEVISTPRTILRLWYWNEITVLRKLTGLVLLLTWLVHFIHLTSQIQRETWK